MSDRQAFQQWLGLTLLAFGIACLTAGFVRDDGFSVIGGVGGALISVGARRYVTVKRSGGAD